MKTTKGEKTKAIYSEMVIARKSVAVTCTWQRLKGGEECKHFIVKRRKILGMLWLDMLAGKVGGRLTRSRESHVMRGAYLVFPGCS